MENIRNMRKRTSVLMAVLAVLAVLAMVLLAGCGEGQGASPTSPAAPTPGGSEPQPTTAPQGGETAPAANAVDQVRVGLDWTPNTNHTGMYVAQDKGYYQDNGLDVDIIQAHEGGTVEQLVAAGQLDFGISFQEIMTNARIEGLPVVSVAAIIQHNTSGFISRASEGITTPADFAGKKYGAFGAPIEIATIKGLMECAGAGDQFNTVEFVEIGSSDFFVATERGDVDFVWAFKGWTGIEAAVRGVEVNFLMMNDLDCIPDYYTPIIITSEQTIAEKPDVVRRFVQATSQGYQFAIANPGEASDILLAAAPELDAELVRRSQEYLSGQYQAGAPRWGEQRLEVWRDYAAWMAQNALIPEMIEPEQAFTNEFLP